MGIVSVDHFVLTVADVGRTLEFYKRLGFEAIGEEEWRRGRRRVPAVKLGTSQKINVHGPDVTGSLRAARPTMGGGDFCLVWQGSIQEVLDLLARLGIPVEEGPVPREGGAGQATSVYFRDPDQNLVEFMVYPQGAP